MARKPMTPGGLARLGGYVLLLWVVVVVVVIIVESITGEALVDDALPFGRILAVIAGLLLLAAGVAKVIQIGVRSARDDERSL